MSGRPELNAVAVPVALVTYLVVLCGTVQPTAAAPGMTDGKPAPTWKIPYGKEFWRRPPGMAQERVVTRAGPSATISPEIDLGDIMDRVSHAFTTNAAGAAGVKAGTYTARVDSLGLHFSPTRPDGRAADAANAVTRVRTGQCRAPTRAAGVSRGRGSVAAASGYAREPITELVLRTRSVRCGDRLVYDGRNRPLEWSISGNTAQALLEGRIGLIEHHEATAQGVEVSWVLQARPPGPGPMEIEVEMQGLEYAGMSSQGIHFSDTAGKPRARIGKVAAVDSAGRRCEVPFIVGNGHVSIRVRQGILEHAQFPLAIDPLISAEFGMDTPVIMPASGSHGSCSVAWNGTNWLVVWIDMLGVPDAYAYLMASRVSAQGAVLDLPGLQITGPIQPRSAPAAASNGRDFLVVWDGWNANTGSDIYGACVTADGQVARPGRVGISVAPGEQTSPSVAGDGGGFMVVWEDSRNPETAEDIYGTRVSEEGLVLDAEGVPICTALGRQSSPSVASGPGGFLIVWSDERQEPSPGSDIFGTRFDRSVGVLDTNGIPICTATNYQGFVSVAAISNTYLAAWQDSRSTGNVDESDIYAALVSPSGVVFPLEGIAVSTAPGNQTRPSVAAGQNEFLAAWSDQGTNSRAIYASRISAAGEVLDPDGIVVQAANEPLNPSAAAYEGGFLVVWDQQESAGTSIRGARLDEQAAFIDPEPILITASTNSEASPAVASNGTNWLVVWDDNRNSASDLYGVRIRYDGTVLDEAAFPICIYPSFQAYPAVAAAGGDYFVAWTDGRNFSANYDDIYGARVRVDGKVLDPQGIPVCTAPDFQSHPAITSDGTNYLVLWQGGDIHGARLNRDGLVLDPGAFPVSGGTAHKTGVCAAFNGKEFLAVWTQFPEAYGNSNDIYGARIRADGLVLDPSAIPISTNDGAQLHPAVASCGGEFLVIWQDPRGGVSGSIYGARVTPAGSVLDPDGYLISKAVYSKVDGVGLAFDRSAFLAVWDSRFKGVTGAWLDASGSPLVTNLTVNADGAYPVVAGGPSNSLLVIGQRVLNGSLRVVGNLVSIFDPPVIRELTLASGAARLSWSAEPGRAYRVQFRHDLSTGNWLDLDPPVTATNFHAALSDPTISQDARRFYRVRRLP